MLEYLLYYNQKETRKEIETMKMILNKCYGGFHLSDKAETMFAKVIGVDAEDFGYDFADDYRTHPSLIAIVEELGKEAYDDEVSELVVLELSDNTTDWFVDEYDGYETVYYVVDGKIKRK